MSTALVSIDEWVTELTARVPNASSGGIRTELKASFREFFTKSAMWIEEVTVNVKADKAIYRLSSSTEGQVLYIHKVIFNGIPLALSSAVLHNVTGVYAYSPAPGELQLFPTPTEDVDAGLYVTVSKTPCSPITQVPREVYTYWFDDILDGALGRIYGQPSKPYSNQLVAQYHLKRFRDSIARARDVGRKKYSSSTIPWHFPRGWC